MKALARLLCAVVMALTSVIAVTVDHDLDTNLVLLLRLDPVQ